MGSSLFSFKRKIHKPKLNILSQNSFVQVFSELIFAPGVGAANGQKKLSKFPKLSK